MEKFATTENIIGYNEQSLNKIILDIYTSNEKIKRILNQISDIVDKTSLVYSSVEATQFRKKYDNFSANYANVVKNINSYSEDLIKFKNKQEINQAEQSNRVELKMISLKDGIE